MGGALNGPFKCPFRVKEEKKQRYMRSIGWSYTPAEHLIMRTGNVSLRGADKIEYHEYLCSCGKVGWTADPRILDFSINVFWIGHFSGSGRSKVKYPTEESVRFKGGNPKCYRCPACLKWHIAPATPDEKIAALRATGVLP